MTIASSLSPGIASGGISTSTTKDASCPGSIGPIVPGTAAAEGQVTPEFLQCQVEVGTKVCRTVGEARDELKKLRAGGSTTTDGAYLVNDQLNAIGRGGTPASVNGYPLYFTNQVPSNLTKGTSSGVCSAVLMGDFSQGIRRSRTLIIQVIPFQAG